MNGSAGNEVDVIIVGSGPGGGSVAKELSAYGQKTLILEKGSGEPIKGTTRQGLSISMLPGKSMHFTQQLLLLLHGVAVGGSTIPYYACAFDPPYEMFDKYGIDLRPEIAELHEELPIAPLADELLGPAARRIMESAQELGFQWNKLPKLAFQENCRAECDKCFYGCPYGAKWTSRMAVEEACEKGSVLLDKAEVKKVIRSNGAAVGVEYVRNGQRYQAFAGTIIVSAGGIGTPQLLRRSGIKEAGYDFFFDPLIIAMGIIDDLDAGKEFPMAAGYHFEEDGHVMTDLVFPRFNYLITAAQVFRFHRLHQHSHVAPIMIKAKDELGGHITKGGGVRKRLGDIERKRLMSGYEKARRILENAGARGIFKTWYLAAHPGGTAKIDDVVDSNLKTEIDNLYVCDCSVIPEAWGLPPTLTLLALGKRLGKHLTG